MSKYLGITGGPYEHEILIVDHIAAGVEHSCQINVAEMDAATMKLFALAEVVERLIMKNPSQYPWRAEIKNLPGELKRYDSPEKLLRVSLNLLALRVMY